MCVVGIRSHCFWAGGGGGGGRRGKEKKGRKNPNQTPKKSEAVTTTTQKKFILLKPTSMCVLLAQNTPIKLPDRENVKGRQNKIYMGVERQAAIFESKK